MEFFKERLYMVDWDKVPHQATFTEENKALLERLTSPKAPYYRNVGEHKYCPITFRCLVHALIHHLLDASLGKVKIEAYDPSFAPNPAVDKGLEPFLKYQDTAGQILCDVRLGYFVYEMTSFGPTGKPYNYIHEDVFVNSNFEALQTLRRTGDVAKVSELIQDFDKKYGNAATGIPMVNPRHLHIGDVLAEHPDGTVYAGMVEQNFLVFTTEALALPSE